MSASIKALVDRGLEVREELKRLEAELGQIESKLTEAGLEREQEYLVDEDREGRRWMAHGSGVVVPVIFTADKIMGSFAKDSARHTQVRVIAGEQFREFYRLTQTYENLFKDGKQFRKVAGELLGARGPAFITACLARDKLGIPKSDVKVAWDDSVPEGPAAPCRSGQGEK